jgi:Protein of unknown function (DUF664)
MDETARALTRSLDHQRAHVLGILEGMDPQALHRPVLPTGWTCVGLVQHLSLDVERFWFQAVMTGEVAIGGDDASAWAVDSDVDPQPVFDRYREHIEHANRIIASTPLEQAPQVWPEELFGDFRLPDLRAIVLHVITETACHAGHLDAARELIDGRTWLIL